MFEFVEVPIVEQKNKNKCNNKTASVKSNTKNSNKSNNNNNNNNNNDTKANQTNTKTAQSKADKEKAKTKKLAAKLLKQQQEMLATQAELLKLNVATGTGVGISAMQSVQQSPPPPPPAPLHQINVPVPGVCYNFEKQSNQHQQQRLASGKYMKYAIPDSTGPTQSAIPHHSNSTTTLIQNQSHHYDHHNDYDQNHDYDQDHDHDQNINDDSNKEWLKNDNQNLLFDANKIEIDKKTGRVVQLNCAPFANCGLYGNASPPEKNSMGTNNNKHNKIDNKIKYDGGRKLGLGAAAPTFVNASGDVERDMEAEFQRVKSEEREFLLNEGRRRGFDKEGEGGGGELVEMSAMPASWEMNRGPEFILPPNPHYRKGPKNRPGGGPGGRGVGSGPKHYSYDLANYTGGPTTQLPLQPTTAENQPSGIREYKRQDCDGGTDYFYEGAPRYGEPGYDPPQYFHRPRSTFQLHPHSPLKSVEGLVPRQLAPTAPSYDYRGGLYGPHQMVHHGPPPQSHGPPLQHHSQPQLHSQQPVAVAKKERSPDEVRIRAEKKKRKADKQKIRDDKKERLFLRNQKREHRKQAKEEKLEAKKNARRSLILNKTETELKTEKKEKRREKRRLAEEEEKRQKELLAKHEEAKALKKSQGILKSALKPSTPVPSTNPLPLPPMPLHMKVGEVVESKGPAVDLTGIEGGGVEKLCIKEAGGEDGVTNGKITSDREGTKREGNRDGNSNGKGNHESRNNVDKFAVEAENKNEDEEAFDDTESESESESESDSDCDYASSEVSSDSSSDSESENEQSSVLFNGQVPIPLPANAMLYPAAAVAAPQQYPPLTTSTNLKVGASGFVVNDPTEASDVGLSLTAKAWAPSM